MNTPANVTQTTYDAILRAYSKIQRANDALQKQAAALTHFSALQADLVKRADKDRDQAIESRLKMESEALALRQRAETAEATSARLEQQLQKAMQDQLKVRREPEVQPAMQQEEPQDGNTQATGANKELKKTHEKEVPAPLKTSTTPRKETSTGQGGRARVLVGAKDVAASVGAGTTAGSRARVRPTTTARARVDATASTACTRARVEATAAARAIFAATAGTGASRMSSAKKQTRTKTGGRRIALGNGC